MPVVIKEHQAEDAPAEGVLAQAGKNRCGDRSNARMMIHPGLQMGSFILSSEDKGKKLSFVISMWGTLDHKVTIGDEPVRFLFKDGSTTTAQGILRSYQRRNKADEGYMVDKIPLGKPHTFAVNTGYVMNIVDYKAETPYKPLDVEVEVPQITLDEDKLAPIKIKYKFVNKLSWEPLNGC